MYRLVIFETEWSDDLETDVPVRTICDCRFYAETDQSADNTATELRNAYGDMSPFDWTQMVCAVLYSPAGEDLWGD